MSFSSIVKINIVELGVYKSSTVSRSLLIAEGTSRGPQQD